MSDVRELKPCPFCGCAARFEEVEGVAGDVRWSVGCKLNLEVEEHEDMQCIGWMSQQSYARKSDAAKAWNRRAS